MNYKCQIFTAQSGALSARVEDENGSTIHFHSLVEPQLENDYFEDLSIWGDRIILLGTGLGYHLSGLLLRIPDQSKIIVIEYYKELAEICIGKISGSRINCITSESSDAAGMLKEFIDGAQYIQFIKHPVSYRVQKDFYDKLTRDAFYSKTLRKEKTTLLLYGNFFLQEELRSAINRCGNAAIFDYRNFINFMHYQNELEKALQKTRPEMIVSVNMKGFDGSGVLSDLSYKYGIPVCVWFVDDPLPILLHQKQFIKSNMIAFCWEKSYLNSLKNAGFMKVSYLPLATSTELFSRSPFKKNIAKIAFVGSAMNGEFLENIRKKIIWNPAYDQAVKLSAKIISNNSINDSYGVLLQICKELNIKLPLNDNRTIIWLHSLIVHTASMIRRKDVIQSMKDYDIETFGDPKGWKLLCGSWLKTNPSIDYRIELASVYRGIEININITSCQMPSAVNQRVFDIPACGGFVINDKQSDLEELFESNEIVTYLSTDELKEKVLFFRNNENERNKISERAFRHIIKEHTYLNRYKTMNCALKS